MVSWVPLLERSGDRSCWTLQMRVSAAHGATVVRRRQRRIATARMIAGAAGGVPPGPLGQQKTRRRLRAPGMVGRTCQHDSRPHTPEDIETRCWARFPDSRLSTGGAFPSLADSGKRAAVVTGYSGGGRAGFAPASLNTSACGRATTVRSATSMITTEFTEDTEGNSSVTSVLSVVKMDR